MPVYVGTSGWQYGHWRGTFYPAGVRQADWLEYYASRFATVELNTTFYRQPRPETFDAWLKRTPEDFVFAVKASRYLTHVRRLRDPRPSVETLLAGARHLRDALGPVLLQLPPGFRYDGPRIEATLAAFPAGVRVAVEPRDGSWFCDELRDTLARHGAALCLADRAGERSPCWRTADWCYVRFHAGLGWPPSGYRREALEEVARLVAERWGPAADCYAYFNNDAYGCAVRDAAVFAAALRSVGLTPTRTPGPNARPGESA